MAKRDVEAGEQRWLEAFNGGDAAGVAQCYAENARLMAPGMDTLEGRAAIEAFGKEFIATGAKLSFELLAVHDGGNLSVAVGAYVMDFPGDIPQDKGKYIEVWAEQGDGSWLIVDDIFNSSLPAPTP